ncbi:MAG: hypothetical protein IJL59_08305 [Clostridia bacterium]|nr:hypothetical protein [Clostridia bacterium]
METNFNDKPTRRRWFRLRPGWQERLPVRPLLLMAAAALVLTLLVLVNRPQSRVLNSAEMEMVKSKGVLRIGVDENVYGLCQNGEGLETDIGNEIGRIVFGSTDSISYVPCTRYSALWRMDDGYIDLAILSMQTFGNASYARNAEPFYVDDCVLVGYGERSIASATVAVLEGTPAETLLNRLVNERSPHTVVVPCADYYSMLVKLRAGTVDAVCMPYTAAMSHMESGMSLYSEPIGTIAYFAIAPTGSILLDLCDELFAGWRQDGTLEQWEQARGL